MVNVLDIQTTQKILLFVNAIMDSLDDIVLFRINAYAHLILHVLVSLLTIDLYVFVLFIDLVLDVFSSIQHVKRMKTQLVKMGDNVFQVMIISYPSKSLHVFVHKALLGTDVR
jgi:hypothetical protein